MSINVKHIATLTGHSGCIYAMDKGIFILQVLYSRWWMRRFNYGPLEWIWRMLTYGKKLKLVKNKSINT